MDRAFLIRSLLGSLVASLFLTLWTPAPTAAQTPPPRSVLDRLPERSAFSLSSRPAPDASPKFFGTPGPAVFNGNPFAFLPLEVEDIVVDSTSFGVWITKQRSLLERRSDGRVLTMTSQDVLGSTFTNVARSRYEYGSTGNVSAWRSDEWLNGTWNEILTATYAYSGAISSITYSSFDPSTQETYVIRERFTYNGYEVIADLEWEISPGVWSSLSRLTHNYHFDGRVQSSLDEEVDFFSGTFREVSRNTYTYDASLRLTEILTETSDTPGVWDRSERTQLFHNGSLTIRSIDAEWDGAAWVIFGRTDYVYENGAILEQIEFEATEGSTFVPVARTRFLTNPIPVELVRFDGRPDGDVVRLTWETASETNNAGFSVERRIEGAFEDLGFVKGHGTTTEPQRYAFTDRGLAGVDGAVEYRLRQVDVDGAFAHSAPIIVRVSVPAELGFSALGANPMRSATTVRYVLTQNGPVRLSVYNVLGQRVALLVDASLPAGPHSAVVPVDRLASGSYFLRLDTPAGARTERFAVVR